MSRLVAIAAVSLLLLGAVPASARVTRIEVQRTEPFADGAALGTAGGYVRISGVAHGELDPAAAVNAAIVNLARAPRNARGLVEYQVPFDALRPAEPARGSRVLLYDVTNRGRKFLLPWLHDAALPPATANDPATAAHAGNGFAFRRGYTVLWSGWDPDAPAENGGLRVRMPVATAGGAPIVRVIRDEFVFGTRLPATSATAPLSYEAATLDQSRARLTVREREADTPAEIPASGWTWAGPRAIRLAPDGTPFRPGVIYDFRYPAKDPKVLGIGYAATRDLVAFVRHDERDEAGTPNPLAAPGGYRAALAVGISQAGRYLRDHVEQGFNQDEQRRKVFDGVLAHIAGAGKVFANAEFGQPNRTNTQHEDHHFPENAFPFSHGPQRDPLTGRTAGLLRGDGFDPLVIEVNTSTEYWQKGASLLHTDPTGRRDIAPPPGVRLFMVAGTQHGGRANLGTDPGSCLHARNPHSAAPLLRALVVALERWTTAGEAPPPSRVPTLADGTLVAAARLAFPRLRDVRVPPAGNHLTPFGDWTDPRHASGPSYATLVSNVDDDGNEVGGVRLPSIAVPTATYTGWNLYRRPYPEGELCDREGSWLPFARTRADRERARDGRPSLEERYGTLDRYVAAVRAAADDLVRQRLLLSDDADRLVDDARRRNPFTP